MLDGGSQAKATCAMFLRIRKLIVISLIAAVILLANTWAIASWLDNAGAVAWARHLRSEYFTGTAIAVIVARLFLLGPPVRYVVGSSWHKRCPVCDCLLLRRGKHCAECGSRV